MATRGLSAQQRGFAPKSLAVSAAVFVLLVVSLSTTRSANTSWTNTGTGNYSQASNWSNGVPVFDAALGDYVYIGNGGTAVINPGDNVVAEILCLGYGASYPAGDGGHIIMNGGTFNTGYVNAYKYTPSSGGGISFTITDGVFLSCNYIMQASGYGNVLTQTGGTVKVVQCNDAPNAAGLGLMCSVADAPRTMYDFRGGTLAVANLGLGGGARFDQSAGQAAYGKLAIGSGPTNAFYRMTGGSLDVHRSLLLNDGGTLDFGNASGVDQAVHLTLGGLVDLRHGAVVHSSLASAAISDHSVVLLPAGKSGTDFFGGGITVDPGAIVASGSDPLAIPADKQIYAWGTLNMPVTVEGALLAKDMTGVANFEADIGALILQNGIVVTNGGRVDTGVRVPGQGGIGTNGTIYINDQVSRIDSGSIRTLNMTMGDSAESRFVQTGGTVEIAALNIGSTYGTVGYPDEPGYDSTYEMKGGSLLEMGGSVDTINLGYTGRGIFDHSGGLVDVSWLKAGVANKLSTNQFQPSATYILRGDAEAHFDAVWLGQGNASEAELNVQSGSFNVDGTGFLSIGDGEGSTTRMTVSGGTVTVGGSISAGDKGRADIVQTGGQVSAGTHMVLGSSIAGYSQRYDLSDGNLIVGSHLTVSSQESAEFHQTGGTVEAMELRLAGNQDGGDYANSTTAATVGEYYLSLGTLSTDTAKIGRFGTGAMYHTGGAFTVSGDMRIGSGTYGVTAGSGRYEMAGATAILSAGNVLVGDDGKGVFQQTGGSVTVSGAMRIGAQASGNGEYRIGGGSLRANALEVGVGGVGTFAVADASASVTVTDRLTLGQNGALDLAPGTVIHMTGSAVDNQSTDAAALGDLANLTLVFEAGPGAISRFEAAGQDLGCNEAGFTGNFALGTLQLGGANAGHVQLVDAFNNATADARSEALYVDKLVLNAGSTLTVGSLNVYFRHLKASGGVVISGGGLVQCALPMPADTDGDSDIDNTDLGRMFGNFTGPGATHKTRADGDTDGDGDVDNSDLGQGFGNYTGSLTIITSPASGNKSFVLLSASAGAGGPYAAGGLTQALEAILQYDTFDGSVELLAGGASGGVITNFVITDAEGGLLNTDGLTNPYGGLFFTHSPFEVSATDGNGVGLTTIDLGMLFPAGLDQDGIAELLETATYVGQLGSGVHNLEIDVINTPEPTAVVLLIAGGLAVIRRRQ